MPGEGAAGAFDFLVRWPHSRDQLNVMHSGPLDAIGVATLMTKKFYVKTDPGRQSS